MPRIFISDTEISDKFIELKGENAAHLGRSLRMRPGEKITLCDGKNREYLCEARSFSPDSVILFIESEKTSINEPDYSATLFMGLPKGDKMDLVIQKSVELGVRRIVPFISSRCVSRPDEKSLEKKIGRWNKIALSAASQCGRGVIPEVSPAVTYKNALEKAAKDDEKFICYEGETSTTLAGYISALEKKPSSISLFIGPEGGFSPEEFSLALSHSLVSVSLGRRILRAETAPLYALSVISALLDD